MREQQSNRAAYICERVKDRVGGGTDGGGDRKKLAQDGLLTFEKKIFSLLCFCLCLRSSLSFSSSNRENFSYSFSARVADRVDAVNNDRKSYTLR